MKLRLVLCAVGWHRWRNERRRVAYYGGNGVFGYRSEGSASFRVCECCGKEQDYNRIRQYMGQSPWKDVEVPGRGKVIQD